jgi:signal transduction histidine kinase/putative methionine-R-sulfoxide reductase with GAF domain
MSDLSRDGLVAQWQQISQETEALLLDAFVRHAIDNRGALTSARRGRETVNQLQALVLRYLAAEADDQEIVSLATAFAEKGMAMVTATQLMRALDQAAGLAAVESGRRAAILWELNRFQCTFLDSVANARELQHMRIQERSQTALQQALHTQLEQQRQMRLAQEERNRNLNRVLQLNARLARLSDENQLLEQAASGICQALALDDVTICERHRSEVSWIVRATTATSPQRDVIAGTDMEEALDAALAGTGEIVDRCLEDGDIRAFAVTLILRLGKKLLGGMRFHSSQLQEGDDEAFLILLRSFAQNLAAMWRNVALLAETRQRARELEILHGRYLDRMWSADSVNLHARYDEHGVAIERKSSETAFTEAGQGIPVQVGGRSIGEFKLPSSIPLDSEDIEFAEALIREMGNALNHAYLLQTTNAYSNQLSLAVEVSRAATTILDRAQLIQEVVELIRQRFALYYVGLFLVDDKNQRAVLQAGTGEAGRLQLARGREYEIGTQTMVGAAIATATTRVEQDVSRVKGFDFDPALPETRSELAVPLRLRGHVIGALTARSVETGAFADETIRVLQSLADQLAVAIANADLFAQLQWSLAKTSHLYEANRQLNTAANERDVYQALVDFCRNSDLVDLALVIVLKPADPDYLVSPALWSRHQVRFNANDRFLRDKFQFGERLPENQLILVDDTATDPTLDPWTRRLFRRSRVVSAALVPIYLDDEWLGTLVLNRTEKKPFSVEELKPFTTLAGQAAIILANLRLFRQTESLYRIGRSLSQTLTRQDALALIVREAAEYTGAMQCRIIFYDAHSGVGSVAAEYRPSEPTEPAITVMAGDFVYEQLSQQRQPFLLTTRDPEIPDSVKAQYLNQYETYVSLLVPAISQKELIGFMALDSQHEKLPFSQSNRQFAQTIVDQLTTQIANIKLLDEALNRAQDLVTLNQIQSQVSGLLDVQRLAETVYEHIGRLLDNTVFILAIFDVATSTYEPVLCIIQGQIVPGESKVLSPDDPLYQVLHAGRVVAADAAAPLMRQAGLAVSDQVPLSSLWIPLQNEGLPSGLISVQSFEVGAYDDDDAQLMRSIATQTSLAIANAQLFGTIQASYEQLRQLDMLKDQFLANMSHELRTPLNSIIGFSRVILKGIDGPITAAQEEDLTSIYDNGRHLLTLINEILDMAKIGADKMTLVFDEVDLAASARDTLATIRSLVDEEKVKLLWDVAPGLPLIKADRLRVRQILMNLLSNAAKYTERGHIRLQIRAAGDHVHIVVEDTGIGISPENYDRVFVAFEQVDQSLTRTAGGTGLGLPITQWLVHKHAGKIWIESEVDKGASFHVTLPVSQDESAPSIYPLSGFSPAAKSV